MIYCSKELQRIKLVKAGGNQMVTSAFSACNVLNLFKVNNRGIRTTLLTSFSCIYRQLVTDFINCPGASIVDFENVNANCKVKNLFGEEDILHKTKKLQN